MTTEKKRQLIITYYYDGMKFLVEQIDDRFHIKLPNGNDAGPSWPSEPPEEKVREIAYYYNQFVPLDKPSIRSDRHVRVDTVYQLKFTVELSTWVGEEPYWTVICPDGMSLEGSEEFDHVPTTEEVIDIAGVWISEVAPEYRNRMQETVPPHPESPHDVPDMYGSR